jgi:hypothetical protein
MRWKDHLFDPAQVDQIWADRRDGYIIIDMEFMPNKLWVAVPDLAWYADNTGVIWLRFDDACQLLLNLFSLPGGQGAKLASAHGSSFRVPALTRCLVQGLVRAAGEDVGRRLGDDNSSAVCAASQDDQEC